MATRRGGAWLLSGAMMGVLVFAFALARRSWFPPIASAHGVEIQRMLDFTLWATGAFLVAGHVALVWLLLRRGPGPGEAAADPSRRARRLVSVLPALLMAAVAEGGVLALALPVWARYYGPPPADAVPVEVTGRQFFWVVRYPGPDGIFGRTAVEHVGTENPLGLDRQSAGGADDVVLLNEMHVPKDRPVLLRLRSTDVIHSFWVPELRLKQNLMPGMSIEVWFTPTRAGAYELACNQICGLGHYRMRGLLHVDEADAFARWLGEQGAES